MEAQASARFLNPSVFNRALTVAPAALPLSVRFFPGLRPTAASATLRSFSRNRHCSAAHVRLCLSPAYPSPNPNRNPNNFLFSISASQLSNSSFSPYRSHTFRYHSSGGVSTWRWSPVPETAALGGGNGLADQGPKVLAVLLGWLGAEEKHLKRYAEWYNSRGMDAVIFTLKVTDLLWFDLGKGADMRILALTQELASWASQKEENGRDRCFIFHTFSNTGWLVYGGILSIFKDRKELLQKIRGCVVDSGGAEPLCPKECGRKIYVTKFL